MVGRVFLSVPLGDLRRHSRYSRTSKVRGIRSLSSGSGALLFLTMEATLSRPFLPLMVASGSCREAVAFREPSKRTGDDAFSC